jgi:hypothetical protein
MKKNFLTFIGTFLLFITLSYSQDTSEYIVDDHVYSLFEQGQYDSVIKYINKHYPMPKDEFDLPYFAHLELKAKCFVLLDQIDSAFNVLFNLTLPIHEDIIYDKDFKKLQSDPRWEQWLNIFIEKNIINDNIEKKDLAKELFLIEIEDQMIRTELLDLISSAESYNQEELSSIIDSFAKKMNTIDSINLLKIEKILKEYGWPSTELVGEQGVNTIFLIIQHANAKARNNYSKLLKKAARKDISQRPNYAYLIDKIKMDKGKKQIYGTQLKYVEEKKCFELFPIKNIKNVDKRREKMFLPNLDEYLKLIEEYYNLCKC